VTPAKKRIEKQENFNEAGLLEDENKNYTQRSKEGFQRVALKVNLKGEI